MNTKLKKTALDDNADIYQHGTKSVTKEEIKKCAKIAKEVKPDFIKTSTGFGTSGATVEDVKLMKDTVGKNVEVKAAGGIHSYAEVKEMIKAGATRIGASATVQIIEEFNR